jgi:hypothetical protein
LLSGFLLKEVPALAEQQQRRHHAIQMRIDWLARASSFLSGFIVLGFDDGI